MLYLPFVTELKIYIGNDIKKCFGKCDYFSLIQPISSTWNIGPGYFKSLPNIEILYIINNSDLPVEIAIIKKTDILP